MLDTMGQAYIYPLFRYGPQIADPVGVLAPRDNNTRTARKKGIKSVAQRPCRIMAYVHYPMISSDMLQSVRDRRPTYNNNSSISQSENASNVKLLYYRIIALSYAAVGKMADLVYVNSSWTEAHIASLWGLQKEKEGESEGKGRGSVNSRSVHKLYPPCNTSDLLGIPLGREGGDGNDEGKGGVWDDIQAKEEEEYVISVGQFRPEKDHSLQLRAFQLVIKSQRQAAITFAESREENGEWLNNNGVKPRKMPLGSKKKKTVLVLLGSTRNAADDQMVANLKTEAESLGLGSHVRFEVNVPYPVLRRWLARASVGLHTMWNEHFGISIVEMMAAGLVVVAHNSGGPKADIVNPPVPTDPYQELEDAAANVPKKKEMDVYTGYLASTAEEYSLNMLSALQDAREADEQTKSVTQMELEVEGIRMRARTSVQSRFSDEAFTKRVQQDYVEIRKMMA